MPGEHSTVATLQPLHQSGSIRAKWYNKKLRQHQSLATIFMAVVYIPYMLLLGFSYDIFEHSLSRIGWRYDGFSFLLAYVLLSVPFMLYQILVNLKFRDERNRIVNSVAIVGLVLLIGGALVPFRETDSDFVLNLHRFCGAAGSIILIFLITYLLIRSFMLHKGQPKKILIASVVYGILLTTSLSIYFLARRRDMWITMGQSLYF